MIQLIPVKSGQVKAIGYDAKTSTLAVTFTRGAGAIYHYPDQPAEAFAAFMAAESKGKFFGEHLQNAPFKKYRGETVSA